MEMDLIIDSFLLNIRRYVTMDAAEDTSVPDTFLCVDVLGDGEETVKPIQYERLSNLCFVYRLVGHTICACSSAGARDSYDGKDIVYGAWLRTASPSFQAALRWWGSRSDKRNQGDYK
ncbi:hypothetical protein QYF36_024466 [Acer negundo]|nr:hypothetical protein QYF36_024466 [Acer negundo]